MRSWSEGESEDFERFFDDRYLFRRRQGATAGDRRRLWYRLEARPWSLSDSVTLVLVLVVSLLCVALLRTTSTGVQQEIVRSSWFAWMWAVAPAAVAIAGWSRPFRGRPWRLAAAMVVPWLGVVWLEGRVWFDPDRGASLWGIIAVWILAIAGLSCVAGYVAACLAVARRQDRSDRDVTAG